MTHGSDEDRSLKLEELEKSKPAMLQMKKDISPRSLALVVRPSRSESAK